MKEEELKILQHSLGVDEFARTPKGFSPYTRNYFCGGAGDEPICRTLVSQGIMKYHGTDDTYPYYNCSVTEKGIKAMLAASPKPPKLTRSQLRYRRFLDADCDMSFRDWIRYEQNDRFKLESA